MKRYLRFFTLIIIGILFLFSGCDKKIDVTGVKIYPSVSVIKVGETKQLTAIVTPDNADDMSVTWNIQPVWMIDTEKVNSISENGKVTGNAEGCASIICITNQLFYEDRAYVYVGYAAAVDAMYSGHLYKEDKEINTAQKIGIVRISEYKAKFGLPFLSGVSPDYCEITVDTISEKMRFEGSDSISVGGVMTLIEVSGAVGLQDGRGDFKIFVGKDVYSFNGAKEPRNH